MQKFNLAVFVSGSGTNCENIIRYFAEHPAIRVRLVVSNRADAAAIDKAARLGVPTTVIPRSQFFDSENVLPVLRKYDINFIVLAGFLLIVPPFLLEAYPHRVINIHPALLPDFGGKGMWGHHVHEAVKAAGVKETGMTVHWVTSEIDGGEIIEQYRVAISPDDTPDDIAAKEHELEMKYFPGIIERVLRTL